MKLNRVDEVYHNLVRDILASGKLKGDRTGTGTVSVFGRQLRFDLSEGFPLLTTKRVWVPGIVHELLWFLQGDTNIKYLVDNKVFIWNEWAYQKYLNEVEVLQEPDFDLLVDDPQMNKLRPMTIKEFRNRISEDSEFAKKWGELGPVYGKQWVGWGGKPELKHFSKDGSKLPYSQYVNTGGINQIQNALGMLKNNPDSRRIMVSAWNPSELNEMALLPCHYAFQLYTTELTRQERYVYAVENKLLNDKYCPECEIPDMVPTRKLSLKWNQRSVDTGLGLPYNIASYALLTHMFAQQANMVVGDLIADLGDTHIYLNHVDKLREQLERESYPLPDLLLVKAKDMFSYTFDDIGFKDYESHPSIKMDISV